MQDASYFHHPKNIPFQSIAKVLPHHYNPPINYLSIAYRLQGTCVYYKWRESCNNSDSIPSELPAVSSSTSQQQASQRRMKKPGLRLLGTILPECFVTHSGKSKVSSPTGSRLTKSNIQYSGMSSSDK